MSIIAVPENGLHKYPGLFRDQVAKAGKALALRFTGEGAGYLAAAAWQNFSRRSEVCVVNDIFLARTF